MFKNRDFVIIGYQSWDIEIGSNCKNIALELAKYNRVLYVNLPIDRKHLLKSNRSSGELKRISVLKGKTEALEVVNDGLWSFYPKVVYESINWIGIDFIHRFLNRLNTKRLSDEINRMVAKLHFKNFILFNDSDMFRGVSIKQMIRPACSIYYIRDNLISQPYFKKHGTETEKTTLRNADVVVTNSPYLTAYAKTYNTAAFYVGQGCDLALYQPKDDPIPKDIAGIKGPKVGFVGYLTAMRLDQDLLVGIAESRPDWNLILVGPEDREFKRSRLHKLDNVFFLGRKPEGQLAAYIEHFDVCINPQLVNELTIGNYPRKIDEYLSMGKPVVATQTPTMRIFEASVYLGTSTKTYLELIATALNEDDVHKRQKRMAAAQQHTWKNCVKAIAEAVDKVTGIEQL